VERVEDAELEALGPLPDGDRYELPVPGTRRGQETRRRILVAAEEVFGAAGYDKASIVAITQQAGVAQGSFYTYFPSKHAVFVELIKDFAVRLRRELAVAVAAGNSGGRAALERRGVAAVYAFVAEHPSLYSVVREAQFVAPDMHRWWYESFAAAYIANFDRLTPKRPRAVDIETIAYAIFALADFFALRWVIWEGKVPPKKVLEQLFQMLATGLDDLLTSGNA
jgi:AcrR family transcriptional regulator